MTKVIHVEFHYNGNDGEDYLGLMRIDDRINELKRILKYSTKFFKIDKDLIFDDIGGVEGEYYTFYVDEVYENMVMCTINTLNTEGNMRWSERFRRKYKVDCA